VTYNGTQFRMARAALGLKTREIAAGARMSMATLNTLEQCGAIADDVPAALRLAAFYVERGITFLAKVEQGPGVRFTRPRARR
jgi:transcriptional regulator with XRE-family HTH domain